MKKIYRLILFFSGVFILALGTVFSDKANLGIAPASSLPFALTYILDLSPGVYFTIIGALYVVIQKLIRGSSFPKIQYLQLFFGFVLGFFIDFSIILLKNFEVMSAVMAIISLFISIILVALGVTLVILSNVIYPSLEGMVKAISDNSKYTFGFMKVFIDCVHVLLSLIISLVYTSTFGYIGFGTLISALVTGVVIEFMLKYLKKPIERMI